MKITMTGTGSILTANFSASALIDDTIQIDVPNGYCKQMRKAGVNVQSLDVILITHFHGDHYFDMPFLLLELGLRNTRTRPLNVFGPSGLESKIRALHEHAFDNWDKVVTNTNVKFNEFTNNWVPVETRTGSYELLAKRVEHEEIEAYGFVVRNGKCAIGYTGDTNFCGAVEEIVTLSDVVIIDVSFLQDTPAHMGLQTALVLAAQPRNSQKKFLATHMTDAVRRADDLNYIIKPEDGFVFDTDENSL